MADEQVFTVLGSEAVPATPISLAEAGLREREHLQEWVLANPGILGGDVLVITSEFDRWASRGGAERDRLDILGLAGDGHLVVAELKRDVAPDTVDMQAIKYAAMASRFDSDTLADAYVEFLRKHQDETLTTEEAVERLAAHVEFGLSDETLRAPKIVLLATQFPSSVTASAVWLSEMGIDITLTRMQAYRTASEVIITVSQHYPPPDVEDFLVAPTRASRRARVPQLPEVEWTLDDFRRLTAEVDNVTIRATLDLCAEHPGEWVPSEAVQQVTGREPAKHRGDYGGFGITVRSRFDRSNPPFQIKWAAGGSNQQYYTVDLETAEMWRAASQEESPDAMSSQPFGSHRSDETNDEPGGIRDRGAERDGATGRS
jgi:hypothetical protein